MLADRGNAAAPDTHRRTIDFAEVTMTQFLADIAGMLEIFAIAGGLVLLHVASRQERARLLKAAGFILVLGGTGVGVCTSYYWFRYQADGLFSSGHAPHHTMMQSGRGLELH